MVHIAVSFLVIVLRDFLTLKATRITSFVSKRTCPFSWQFWHQSRSILKIKSYRKIASRCEVGEDIMICFLKDYKSTIIRFEQIFSHNRIAKDNPSVLYLSTLLNGQFCLAPHS